jgi:predicted DNA-binding protein YlxM (UPF0122 family)
MENNPNTFNKLNTLTDFVYNLKPRTIKNYAKEKSISVQAVYQGIKRGRVMYIEVDGIKFIIE